jgi:hypothetical protein
MGKEFSLAERPRGKRLIAPRTTVMPGELLAGNRTKPKCKEWRGNPESRPSQLCFKLNPKEQLDYFWTFATSAQSQRTKEVNVVKYTHPVQKYWDAKPHTKSANSTLVTHYTEAATVDA